MSLLAPALVLAMVIGAGAAEKALEKRVSVAFDGAPFIECLQVLKEKAAIAFAVERDEPEIEILKRPVTLKLRNVRVREVLDELVEQVEAGYVRRGPVLHFMPRERAARAAVVPRFYEVRDITSARFEPYSRVESRNSIIVSASFDSRELTASQIGETIQSRVAPDSWAAELGTSIDERGGRLLIFQTPEVHAKVEGFLSALGARAKRMIEFRIVVLRPGTRPETPFLGFIDGEAAADLIEKGETLREYSTLSFADRRLEIMAGEDVTHLAGIDVEKGAYDPYVWHLFDGLFVKVEAVHAEGAGAVVLDIEIDWRKLNGFSEKKIASLRSKGAAGTMKFQKPDLQSKVVKTSLCIPRGKWAVIGLPGRKGVAALVMASVVGGE